ncbi:MAG: DNA adenine methylase [Desulfobacteraceae bacterium]|nr:DNA adenine methylase [Desulfobacteraceae bacterium]
MTPCKIRRPALRYHGGKWRLASWIISQFPEHRCYVEPYGGAASVLLKKPKSFFEVYNDLDQNLVNLFEVVRNTDTRKQLIHELEKTPFARKEFETAYLHTDDPIHTEEPFISMPNGRHSENCQAVSFRNFLYS